jgi:FkbM family methyltransferase
MGSIIAQLRSRFARTEKAVSFVNGFFLNFSIEASGFEERNIIWEGILVGLLCNVCYFPVSKRLATLLETCKQRETHFRERHHGIGAFAPEVFCTGQGLENLNSRLTDYIRPRAAMDIGAFCGDSAVVFLDYAKDVYSFEPSPQNFRALELVLTQNRGRYGTGHAFNLALSDSVRVASFINAFGSGAEFGSKRECDVDVNVTTLDLFVAQHNITVGFVKADTEGHGLPIVKGGIRTLQRDRPVLALTGYHNVDELFNIPLLLKEVLQGYEYRWEFGVDNVGRLFEVLLIGWPAEVLFRQ